MKLSTAEKRRIRLLVRSHIDHAVLILRTHAPYSQERARRSLKDAEDLFNLHRSSIPQRSRDALWNRLFELRAKLDGASHLAK